MAAIKVLVLEDDNEVAEWLRRLLTTEGYHPFIVRNGAAGVREMVKQCFDAIICDLSMPLLPGDMFYKAVERSKPHLCSRFIFITGQELTDRVADFFSAIGANVLLKPFEGDELLKLLAAVAISSPDEILYESPLAEDRSVRAFSGVVRVIDLDRRQFELRQTHSCILCTYPPQIESGVIRSLNKNVRTFGRIEETRNADISLLKVERIEIATESRALDEKNRIVSKWNRNCLIE